MRPLVSIVAMQKKDRLIGRDGGLPWKFPEDLKFFKQSTLGHAIIMGRKTYEEVGRPLPGRRNIVISRRAEFSAPGCEVVSSLLDAVALARTSDSEPCVIGGAEIYRLALPLTTTLLVTEIDGDFVGDTYFPDFRAEKFREVSRRRGETPELEFVRYER